NLGRGHFGRLAWRRRWLRGRSRKGLEVGVQDRLHKRLQSGTRPIGRPQVAVRIDPVLAPDHRSVGQADEACDPVLSRRHVVPARRGRTLMATAPPPMWASMKGTL